MLVYTYTVETKWSWYVLYYIVVFYYLFVFAFECRLQVFLRNILAISNKSDIYITLVWCSLSCVVMDIRTHEHLSHSNIDHYTACILTYIISIWFLRDLTRKSYSKFEQWFYSPLCVLLLHPSIRHYTRQNPWLISVVDCSCTRWGVNMWSSLAYMSGLSHSTFAPSDWDWKAPKSRFCMLLL